MSRSPAEFMQLPRPTTVQSGGAVVAALERPVGGKEPLPVVLTFAFAVLTAGIGPLLRDMVGMGMQTRGTRSRLWHLADLLAARGFPDHRKLADRTGPKLLWLVVFIAVAQAGVVGWSLCTGRLWNLLWSGDRWYFAYLGICTLGYVVLVMDLAWHHLAVRRFLNKLDFSRTRPKLLPWPTVAPLIGALVAGAVGWYWAIPALVGSAVLRREIDRNSREWAVGLAGGVRMRPGLFDGPLPRSHANLRQCRTPRCATDLVPMARFCPVCGAEAPRLVEIT